MVMISLKWIMVTCMRAGSNNFQLVIVTYEQVIQEVSESEI